MKQGFMRLLPIRIWALFLISGCDESTAPAPGAPIEKPSRIDAPRDDAADERAPTKSPAPTPAAVDLSGTSRNLTVNPVEKGPRVYARYLRTWVYQTPSRSSSKLGYLRAGSSSPTSEPPASRAGCKGGWYPVHPKGYVCVGKQATLDPADPVIRLFEAHPPRFDQKLPYRYGTVRRPGPVYRTLPNRDALEELEPGFSDRFPRWLEAEGEIGASFRQEVWLWGKKATDASVAWKRSETSGVPKLLSSGGSLPSPLGRPRPNTKVLDRMAPRAGHAFLDTFYFEGRRYGLSTHLELAPLDRYRPIVGSDFHGVEIGKDVQFPFAFVRRVGAKYTTGERVPYRRVLQLTGKRKLKGNRFLYETDEGKYISDRYASELRLAKKMPKWAKDGEKWMSISIGKQTLVLYEGTKPVFATLVSTGEAGLEDHETSTATKRGWFRVHTKHVTSTMASDVVGEAFELRDVPYVQYFAQGGYALHGAYWHDRFGTPKSHGCINLAPEDARRIFHWTDPPVPPGWHGALLPLKGTVVFIHP